MQTLKLRDGEPCSHLGCASHLSHPCEGCGRTGARGDVEILRIESHDGVTGMSVIMPARTSAESGLTLDEQKVMDALTEAWTNFMALPTRHPDELPDFRRAIHDAQRLLAMRVVAREHGQFWWFDKSLEIK